MKLCKTCAHRKAPEHTTDWSRLGFYLCENTPMFWASTYWVEQDDATIIQQVHPDFAHHKAFVQDGSDYRAYLVVAEDFGCVMHEDAR